MPIANLPVLISSFPAQAQRPISQSVFLLPHSYSSDTFGRPPMLDSCPSLTAYCSPSAGGDRTAYRRRPSSARCRPSAKMPEVVAVLLAKQRRTRAPGESEQQQNEEQQEEEEKERGSMERATKTTLERMTRPATGVGRSQSQLACRPAARVLGRSAADDSQRIHRHSRRSYDANALCRPPVCAGGHDQPEQRAESGGNQLTLVLMGAPKVGKSALVNQFLWEVFLADYRPTVEEFNWVEYGTGEEEDSASSEGGGGRLLLQLIDSSGSRDFLAMRHLYYRIGDAFMVVYAANDPQSYVEALAMLREIGAQNTKEAPILLLQNKADLVPRGSGGDSSSKCSGAIDEAEESQLLARVRKMRISAKNLDQVKGAFWWLIDELVRRAQIGGSLPPPVNEGSKGTDRRASNGSLGKLTRRRQSMPSRRTASELGIDDETMRRFMHKHEAQHGRHHGCVIQ